MFLSAKCSYKVLLLCLTTLFYRYNKKELTNIEVQEQTASFNNYYLENSCIEEQFQAQTENAIFNLTFKMT